MSQPSKPSPACGPGASAYFLVGVTACGKSAVAQHIAENEGYHILSADSMLVYRGMDIGTAKPSLDERSRVTYHGIDLVAPGLPFSTWDYREYAAGILAANSAAGKKTIVVGGSGLYVKSLTAGLREAPGADPSVRSRWAAVLERDGVEALQQALKERYGAIYDSLEDKANPRRLVRALEMAEAGVEELDATWGEPSHVPMAGLEMPREELSVRIRDRVRDMYERGFVAEVKGLLGEHGALSDTARHAIGYAEVLDLLAGQCTVDDAVERTVARTRQLAKRQQTWFNHQANVCWIETGCGVPVEETAERVTAHWRKHGPGPIAGT